ncbi:MAG: hypothetical protein RLP44_08745 [Aggregatilineales bacterium]
MTEPDSRSQEDLLHDILILLEHFPDGIVIQLTEEWERIAHENGWLPPPRQDQPKDMNNDVMD